MTGPRFTYCPTCKRLLIYGATCTCGTNTNRPTQRKDTRP